VEVTLRDGSKRSVRVMDSIGTPAAPPSLDDLLAKYADLTAPVSSPPPAADAEHAARALIDAPTPNDFMEMLANVS
ncbi:MAG: hypothetical protein AAGL49_08475, partial [Pseudomonadota bacterium]